MNKHCVWIHEKGLKNQSFWQDWLAKDYQLLHIWDDNYYKKRDYSFQRLVFIYESLCDLDINIIRGNIVETFKSIHLQKLVVPFTPDLQIQEICHSLSQNINLAFIYDDAFVDVEQSVKCNKFFKYWSFAKKAAFLHNGSNFSKLRK